MSSFINNLVKYLVDVNASVLVPSVVVISPDHEMVYLTLKSPTITVKSDLF